MINKQFLLKHTSTAKEALNHFNAIGEAAAVLFVLDENQKVIGTLTDGDIRRGLLNDVSINESVQSFLNKDFKYIKSNESPNQKLSELRKQKIRYVPVLNEELNIVKVFDLELIHAILPVDVIIMAGGEGRRLLPLTEKIPKPLLKIGDKPIIEHNIDRLIHFGVDNFYITLRYLGEQIRTYFGNGESKSVKINYAIENRPLGTFGAVGLIENFNHDYVLVMNSDLLTTIDYNDFFKYFIEKEADMAVASIPYHVDIPYAVFEFSDGKQVSSFREKPRYTYYSNAGIYLIKKEFLELIPKNEKFDATDMMNLLIKKNKKLISYSITGYWLDIGRMDDFNKAQEDIKHIQLN